jgi:hypothetical protein
VRGREGLKWQQLRISTSRGEESKSKYRTTPPRVQGLQDPIMLEHTFTCKHAYIKHTSHAAQSVVSTAV